MFICSLALENAKWQNVCKMESDIKAYRHDGWFGACCAILTTSAAEKSNINIIIWQAEDKLDFIYWG